MRRGPSDFNSLSAFLRQVESLTEDLIYGVEDAVFHYTDLGGLRGIVQNNDLWLTHSRFSNDDEEITYGYRIVNQVIEEQRNNAVLAERVPLLDKLAELVKEPTPEGVYICCFCLEDDLLSQWRGYGGNGTGVSVQFDPKQFDYITGPDSPHGGLVRLWKVFYDEKTQASIVRQAIDFAYLNAADDDSRSKLAADIIQFFIPTFKNESFSEEKECRLIFTPKPDFSEPAEFRVARGMLIPYYSLKKIGGPSNSTRQLPISGVKIGPSANRHLNKESAEMILAQGAFPEDIVTCSETPFRGY